MIDHANARNIAVVISRDADGDLGVSARKEPPSLRNAASTSDARGRMQRTYRRIAPWFDLLDLGLEYGRYRTMRAAVFGCVRDAQDLLDCGAGTGRNGPFYPPDARVIPFDLSMEMLQRARLRMKPGTPIVQADAMQLPFASQSFDAATATFLFCVLPDELQEDAIREICRVLKPGGRLVLLEYVLSRHPLRRAWMRLWSGWVDFAYGASFTRKTDQHLRRAGMAIEQRTFLHADTIEMIVARSESIIDVRTTDGPASQALGHPCGVEVQRRQVASAFAALAIRMDRPS